MQHHSETIPSLRHSPITTTTATTTTTTTTTPIQNQNQNQNKTSSERDRDSDSDSQGGNPNKSPKPPPISIHPALRRFNAQPNNSLSSLLNSDSHSSSAGQQLELAERFHWDQRTGRSVGLAMSLQNHLPISREGGRDRWGNRWGIENHILSPVISERTEPTHTSVSSPISTASLSITMESNPSRSPPQLEKSDSSQSQKAHHQHAMNLLNRKKIKNQISNRQRDLDVAQRQITKRIEKQKRDQMICRRDEIAAQLIQNPTNAKLVRDLGKLYLEFHHPTLENKPIDSFRQSKSNNNQTTSRSEPSLKLAIHYLEQSIQLDNLDPLTWLYLAKAWSLLLAYPTEHTHEREQRLSNSSLAFRKAIVISSNLSDSNNPNIQQTNRFRLSYAQHLESIQKYREAASILQDALELDDIDADCWWALGRMMELWALDTESDTIITKQERLERMKHSCEAYQRAFVLQPEDETIRESKSNGEQVLEKFKVEVKAEEEAQAKALKAEEEITITAERIRGLNLSPFTTKVPSTTSTKPNETTTTKSSSALALKKLVAELREIPEFGKKATLPHPTNPSPFPSNVGGENQSNKEPDQSIDSIVTQVESVTSNSPTPSNAVQQIQASVSESDGSSCSHFSPSSQMTHENSNTARGLGFFPPSSPTTGILAPKNPASDSSHISLISITPSTPNLSPTSTHSHDDVRMTIMSLTTPSMESASREVKNSTESPGVASKSSSHHTFHSNSYAPPSPSTLPTSRMQSLSSRSSTSKAPMVSPPCNILTSIPTSCDQKQVSHKNSPHVTSSQSASGSPTSSILLHSPHFGLSVHHDQQRIQTSPRQTPPICESSNPKHPQPKDEQNPQRPISVLSPNQNGDFHNQEGNFDSSKSHSSPRYSQNHVAFDNIQQDSHAEKSMNGSIDRGQLNSTRQNELQEPSRSPPPPQIPPRPKSVCIHPTVPMNFNSISESSLGISMAYSPQPTYQVDASNPHQKSDNNGYQFHVQRQNINQHQLDSTRSPRSPDIRRKRSTSLMSPISKPLFNDQVLVASNHNHLSPPHLHQSLGHHQQQSFQVYDYSLIDSHLQSILEVDMKRKAELREIKKQIRKTDEWAENQRRSIVEEIRRICTPVNNHSSINTKKVIQDQRNHIDQEDDDDDDDDDDEEDVRSSSCSMSRNLNSRDVVSRRTTKKNSSMKRAYIRRRTIHQEEEIGKKGQNYVGSNNNNKNNQTTYAPRRSVSTPPQLDHQPYTQQIQEKQTPHNEYQPLCQPNSNPNPTHHLSDQSLKPDHHHHHHSSCCTQNPILFNHQLNEFDRLGPAGFAINGITSIIQLLHQPRRK